VNGAYAVYHANPDGTLGARLTALTLGTGWTELVALGVTGDGRPELGFYNATSGSLAVYATTTAGALDIRLSPSVIPAGLSALESVQITGDARPELALYDRTSDALSIYTIDETGQLAARLRPAAGGFLTRQGKNLMLDGTVFKFVGVNAFGLTGCRTGTPDTQAVMDAFFASLRPRSITRTWAFKPQGLAGVRRVVATADSHNQKLVLALADGANFCDDTGHDATFYKSGFRGAYFDWIRQVVPLFKDSPAVGIWEIMNEPGNGSTGVLASGPGYVNSDRIGRTT
jgi:hypothetical protein